MDADTRRFGTAYPRSSAFPVGSTTWTGRRGIGGFIPAKVPAVLLSVLFVSAPALAPRAAAASEPWTGHAVIVGISDYEGSSMDLRFCDDDAQDVSETLLLDTAHWSDSNIDLILDSDATVGRIQPAIEAMRLATKDTGNVCVFYFSGHGGYVADVSPLDEDDGDPESEDDDYDEVLCAYDGDIYDDDLETWFSDFTTQRVCVIVDTCFAGGMAKSGGGMSPSEWLAGMAEDIARVRPAKAARPPAARRKDLDDLVSVNIVALMACEDVQTSEEDFILENGVFTFFVVEAMRRLITDTNSDTFFSAEEIFAYAAPRAEEWNPSQTPYLYDADTDELRQVPLLAAGDQDTERIVTEKDLPFGGGITGGCEPSGPRPVGQAALALLAALGVALGVMVGRKRTTALALLPVLILLVAAGCSQVCLNPPASPAHAPERYVPIEAAAGPGADHSDAGASSLLPGQEDATDGPARRQTMLSWGVRAGLVAPLGPLGLTNASYSQTVQVGLFAAGRLWKVPFEIGADVYRIRSPDVPVAADVLSGRLDVVIPGGLTPEGRELYYHFGPRALVDLIESDTYWDGTREVVAALGAGAGVRRPRGGWDARVSVDWLLGSENIAGLLSVNVGVRF